MDKAVHKTVRVRAGHRCDKGPNLSSIDPISNEIVPLFHPRRQQWDEHFTWDGARLIAKTPAGRATLRSTAWRELSPTNQIPITRKVCAAHSVTAPRRILKAVIRGRILLRRGVSKILPLITSLRMHL